MTKLSEKIKILMIRNLMTNPELAKRTGLKLTNVIAITKGATKGPSIETIEKIADALHVDLCFLIDDQTDIQDYHPSFDFFIREFNKLNASCRQRMREVVRTWSK